MSTLAIMLTYLILATPAAALVGYLSRRSDAFEQVRFSPWLANFEEYSAHAVDEGYRAIEPDEDRTVYIRFIERQRERKMRQARRR